MTAATAHLTAARHERAVKAAEDAAIAHAFVPTAGSRSACVYCGKTRNAKAHKVTAAPAATGLVADLAEAATVQAAVTAAEETPAVRVVPRTTMEDRVEASMARAAAKRAEAEVADEVADEDAGHEHRPYRIGKVLREFVLAAEEGTYPAALVEHIAGRNVCYDGTATLRICAPEAERLIDAAGDLEVAVKGEDSPVPAAQRAPAVMAARAARRTLHKLFA
jgi:hypothetical protein